MELNSGLELPENEFSYIGRPWETFTGRWAAIREAMLEELPGGVGEQGSWASGPTVVDLGSNNGYFSLQTARLLPRAAVIGVEGAVGVGNGTLGTTTSQWLSLCQTTAIQTHLRWVQKLRLQNCLLAPEVWDYNYILSLAERGMCADVMFSLSVVHHIDDYSARLYSQHPGLGGEENRVEAFLQLMRRLLELAKTHIVELPDSPWISHVHAAFQNNPEKILQAACQRTSFRWNMRKIYSSSRWIGHREVWLLQRQPDSEAAKSSSLSSLRPFFEVLLPPPEGEVADQKTAELLANALALKPPLSFVTQRPPAAGTPAGGVPPDLGSGSFAIAGTRQFTQEALLGKWINSQSRLISLVLDNQAAESETRCLVSYHEESRKGVAETFPLVWAAENTESSTGGCWKLSNNMGQFMLAGASASQLCWKALVEQPWYTTWNRVSS